MHPNLEELLALRDGEGSNDVAGHVDACVQCSAEIDRLRAVASALAALPPVEVETNHWPALRERIVRRRRRVFGLRFAAAAACVVTIVSAVVISRSRGPDVVDAAGVIGRPSAIEELTEASRGLEHVLRDPALKNQVMSARRAAVIVDLEDRLTVLDLALARNSADRAEEQAVALWSHRVELLDALVSARGAGGPDDGVGYAVFRYEGSQP